MESTKKRGTDYVPDRRCHGGCGLGPQTTAGHAGSRRLHLENDFVGFVCTS